MGGLFIERRICMMSSKSKPFTALGIDASLTGTGLCLLTWDSLERKKPKTITLTNSLKGIPRLIYIEQEVEKWAKEADIIVIENYAFHREFNREALAELQGVLKRRLYLMGKKVLIVNTQKVKKILTGSTTIPKGKKKIGTKKWTIQQTRKNYGIDFKTAHNECDAFGLALIGICYHMYNINPEILNKYPLSKTVVDEIVNPQIKTKKHSLNYYLNLPYKICVFSKDDKTFTAYCPALDYEWQGNTLKEAIDNAEKGKKERIRQLRNNKVRIKTSRKYMGGISYIVKK